MASALSDSPNTAYLPKVELSFFNSLTSFFLFLGVKSSFPNKSPVNKIKSGFLLVMALTTSFNKS